MSEKKFTLLNAVSDFDSSIDSASTKKDSDFELCFICQEESGESLLCPATNSTHPNKSSGYLTIAQQLKKFEAINELPKSISCRISHLSCNDLLESLFSNEAKFHKKCRNKYDKQHYERISQKRKLCTESGEDDISRPSTRTRYTAKNFQPKCLFCDQEDNMDRLTKAQTLELDRKVRDVANQLCDEVLLAKLSEGDMIAIEAVYHKTCLTALYNRLRESKTSQAKIDSESVIIEGIVLAEVVNYINSSKESNEDIPVFLLSDLKSLYSQRLKTYGYPDTCVEHIHSTRLK